MPADGVKGKTWGPSTCHQRERSQIPLRPLLAPRPGGIWSKSAPNLDKSRNALSRPQHDIGNTSDANPDSSLDNSVSQFFKSTTTESNLSNSSSTLQLFKNKFSAISYNAFGITDFKPFRFTSQRNNSFPTHVHALSPRDALARQNRLSRSIGNITESHYDTVFSTDSFVIARGISTNSSLHLNSDLLELKNDDREKLISD